MDTDTFDLVAQIDAHTTDPAKAALFRCLYQIADLTCAHALAMPATDRAALGTAINRALEVVRLLPDAAP